MASDDTAPPSALAGLERKVDEIHRALVGDLNSETPGIVHRVAANSTRLTKVEAVVEKLNNFRWWILGSAATGGGAVSLVLWVLSR